MNSLVFFHEEGNYYVNDISAAVKPEKKARPRIPETDEYQKWQKGFGSPSPQRPIPPHSL